MPVNRRVERLEEMCNGSAASRRKVASRQGSEVSIKRCWTRLVEDGAAEPLQMCNVLCNVCVCVSDQLLTTSKASSAERAAKIPCPGSVVPISGYSDEFAIHCGSVDEPIAALVVEGLPARQVEECTTIWDWRHTPAPAHSPFAARAETASSYSTCVRTPVSSRHSTMTDTCIRAVLLVTSGGQTPRHRPVVVVCHRGATSVATVACFYE